MMIVSGEGNTIRGPTSADMNYSLAFTPTEKVLSGEKQEESTDDDGRFLENLSAEVLHEGFVTVEDFSAPFDGVTFESVHPGIATVDAEGTLTRVADGTAGILTRHPWTTKRVDCPVLYEPATATAQEFLYFVDGSLARAMNDQIDSLIAEGDPAVMIPMYTDSSRTARNTSNWAAVAGYDLSCIDRNRPNACLITQRHGIQADHYKDNTDTFCDMDNNIVSRSVIARRQIGSTDISVVKYAEALPAAFIPALIAPAPWNSHFVHYLHGVACMATNQAKGSYVKDMRGMTETWMNFASSSNARRAEFNKTMVSGSSGSPIFALLPGLTRLTLLSGWYSALTGPNHSQFLTEIQAAINEMGDGLAIATADLSAYPTY